uniref:Uncharacterized protein n=1 Tax=Spongospora subterranea TaxID=70186 RepID=A0A0H5R9Q6_9EUKA|eukprot:CRZ05164.1 hypothetical protein [Spongospora subterranea]
MSCFSAFFCLYVVTSFGLSSAGLTNCFKFCRSETDCATRTDKQPIPESVAADNDYFNIKNQILQAYRDLRDEHHKKDVELTENLMTLFQMNLKDMNLAICYFQGMPNVDIELFLNRFGPTPEDCQSLLETARKFQCREAIYWLYANDKVDIKDMSIEDADFEIRSRQLFGDLFERIAKSADCGFFYDFGPHLMAKRIKQFHTLPGVDFYHCLGKWAHGRTVHAGYMECIISAALKYKRTDVIYWIIERDCRGENYSLDIVYELQLFFNEKVSHSDYPLKESFRHQLRQIVDSHNKFWDDHELDQARLKNGDRDGGAC